MTYKQVAEMYKIEEKLKDIRRDLDAMCFYTDEPLKGEDYDLARSIHAKVCEALDLM